MALTACIQPSGATHGVPFKAGHFYWVYLDGEEVEVDEASNQRVRRRAAA